MPASFPKGKLRSWFFIVRFCVVVLLSESSCVVGASGTFWLNTIRNAGYTDCYLRQKTVHQQDCSCVHILHSCGLGGGSHKKPYWEDLAALVRALMACMGVGPCTTSSFFFYLEAPV